MQTPEWIEALDPDARAQVESIIELKDIVLTDQLLDHTTIDSAVRRAESLLRKLKEKHARS